MCYTLNNLATCRDSKRKSVSIITAKAATQVFTLEEADVSPEEVSPQYSPTSPPAEARLSLRAMDRTEQVNVLRAMGTTEQVTDSLVEKKRLLATKGTVKTQFSKPSSLPDFSNFSVFYSKQFFVPFA